MSGFESIPGEDPKEKNEPENIPEPEDEFVKAEEQYPEIFAALKERFLSKGASEKGIAYDIEYMLGSYGKGIENLTPEGIENGEEDMMINTVMDRLRIEDELEENESDLELELEEKTPEEKIEKSSEETEPLNNERVDKVLDGELVEKQEEETSEGNKEPEVDKPEKSIEKEEPPKRKGIGGIIAKTSYDTITSVLGVKTLTDVAGAYIGILRSIRTGKKEAVGDIANYILEKDVAKQDRKGIENALNNIAEEWNFRREMRKEGHVAVDKSMDNEALRNAISGFKEKLAAAESIPEEEKKEFKRVLASIVSERSKKQEANERLTNEKTKKALGAYIKTKVKGTRLVKDGLNLVLTFSGLLALRGVVYGGVAMAERAKEANVEFTKKELLDEVKRREKGATLSAEISNTDKEKELSMEEIEEYGKKYGELDELTKKLNVPESKADRIKYIIKDITVNSAVETARGLSGKGRKKGSEHKKTDFVHSLGNVLRGAGIGGMAVDDFLDSLETEHTEDIGEAISKNINENTEQIKENINIEDPKIEPSDVANSSIPTQENIAEPSQIPSELKNISPEKDVPEAPENPSPKPGKVAVADTIGTEKNIPPAETVKESTPEIKVEYQGGKSVWGEIENQLDDRSTFKETFKGMGEAERTYLIDYLKDKVVAHPEEYGLPEGTNADNLTQDQLKNLDWDKLFKESSTPEELKRAIPNLTEEQRENILRNNQILREYVQETGKPLDSETVENLLSHTDEAATEAAGSAEDINIENIQSRIEEEIGKGSGMFGKSDPEKLSAYIEDMARTQKMNKEEIKIFIDYLTQEGKINKEVVSQFFSGDSWNQDKFLEKIGDFKEVSKSLNLPKTLNIWEPRNLSDGGNFKLGMVRKVKEGIFEYMLNGKKVQNVDQTMMDMMLRGSI